MKRLIAAVSFAVFAVPAFAMPFEQTQFDRGQPQISDNASAGAGGAATVRGAPFEQTELDRAQPDVTIKAREARGPVRETVDYNFVAPAL